MLFYLENKLCCDYVPQKDHIISSLDDLFARYTPPVEPHRYSVEFIPVVDLTATEQEKLDILTYDPRCVSIEEQPFNAYSFLGGCV